MPITPTAVRNPGTEANILLSVISGARDELLKKWRESSVLYKYDESSLIASTKDSSNSNHKCRICLLSFSDSSLSFSRLFLTLDVVSFFNSSSIEDVFFLPFQSELPVSVRDSIPLL